MSTMMQGSTQNIPKSKDDIWTFSKQNPAEFGLDLLLDISQTRY